MNFSRRSDKTSPAYYQETSLKQSIRYGKVIVSGIMDFINKIQNAMEKVPESDELESVFQNKKDWKEVKKTIKHISGLAGIDEKDIEIELKKDVVKIRAKKGARNYHAMVPLAQKIFDDDFKAKFGNGSLELIIDTKK